MASLDPFFLFSKLFSSQKNRVNLITHGFLFFNIQITHLSLLSCLRPPYSIGGLAGRPWRSIHEHVCRNGWLYAPPPPPPPPSAGSAGPPPRNGGPKPCSGAEVFNVGGARTVMLICRDDFSICTHLWWVRDRKMAIEETTTRRAYTEGGLGGGGREDFGGWIGG